MGAVLQLHDPARRVFRDPVHALLEDQPSLGRTALALAARGFAVFPCWPGTKRPLGDLVPNGHLEATTEPWLIKYWWGEQPDANIGVVPGRCDPPLIVLDADVKAGKRGLETLAAMERDGLIPPDAPRVRTPSGGVHVYLRLPAGAEPVGNHSPFKDVDVRSANGYVLVPPSVVDGAAYELVGGGMLVDRPAPEAPTELVRRLGEAPKRDKAEPGECAEGVRLDSPANIRRATELAARLLADGPKDRFKKACRIKDEGVSQAECLRIMREAGFPEEGQTSLEAKVASAYRHGQNGIGSRSPEHMFADVMAEAAAGQTPAADEPPLYPTSLTRARDAARAPRKPYLIDGFVKECEVNLAPGDGGAGKGRFWMQVAVAVAAGQKTVFGLPIRQRVPAVFVSAEDDDGELYRRARGIALELGLPDVPKDLHFVSLVEYGGSMALAQVVTDGGVAPGPFLEPLVRLLAPLGDHLLILDAASDAADIDENAKGQANAFLKRYVRRLCATVSSTVVLIAHPTKSAMKDRTFVSSPGWRNGVRSMVCGERVRLDKGRWVPDPGSRGPDFYARFWQDKGNDLEHTVPELILRSVTGRVGFTLAGAPVELPDGGENNAFAIWAEAIADHMRDKGLRFFGLNRAAKHLAELAERTPKDERAALGYAGDDGKARSQNSFYTKLVGTRGNAPFKKTTVFDGDYSLELKEPTIGVNKSRGFVLVDQNGVFV